MPDLNQKGTIEEGGPASHACMMEGSEVESVSEGPHPENQLQNNQFIIEEEQQISHNNADEAEKGGQAHDERQIISELIKTATDIETDVETEAEAQMCNQEHSQRDELQIEAVSDNILLTGGQEPSLSNDTGKALLAQVTTLEDVVESAPSVLEGTIETALTFDEVKDSHAINSNSKEQSSVLVRNCFTAPSLAHDDTSNVSPSNGPSTPSSDTVSSSLTSSPQTSSNTSAPLPNPYDTDCSRKLISQIHRSPSQESLLDELESELLACQLADGEGGGDLKRSPTVNGLATDQEGCMVVFEKCVQYKYAQQEKAIQR